MKPKLINLADYEFVGEGANGQSFNLRSNSNVMLKLYNIDAPEGSATRELEFATKIYEAGIPTPKPGEYVTDGKGRTGVQFERIFGKKSYCRAISEDFASVEKYSREFGQMCRELHQVHLDPTEFPDVRVKYKGFLDRNPFFTEDEKKRVRDFIDSIPFSDIANHGDLQFGNAIRVENGTETRRLFIDVGDFAIGHPYTDLGQVLLCSKYEDEAFSREYFHLTCAQAAEFWKYFVKGYWGEDADADEWERIIRPYAGLKTLLIQHYSPMEYPHFKKILMECV